MIIRAVNPKNEFMTLYIKVESYRDYEEKYQSLYWDKSLLDVVNKETLKAFELVEKFGLREVISENYDCVTDWEDVEDFEDYIISFANDVDFSFDYSMVDFAKVLAYYTKAKELFGSKPVDDDKIENIIGFGYDDI